MHIPHFRKTPMALAVALALYRNPVAQAAPGDFVSDFFRVNRATAGTQSRSDVAMDAVGNSVIVWQSNGQDGDGFGIFGQRYRAGGIRVGPEFPINNTKAGDQTNPVVAMDADGDFVVAWESPDADGTGIRARRFTRAGTPRGADFKVNSETANDQFGPSIASDAFGEFIVAWTNGDLSSNSIPSSVRLKRYLRNGAPIPVPGQAGVTEFLVDTSPDSMRSDLPAVAMDADGDHVIVWRSIRDGHFPAPYTDHFVKQNIISRAYNRFSQPMSGDITVFPSSDFGYTSGTRDYYYRYDLSSFGSPGVAMDSDGDFVVVAGFLLDTYLTSVYGVQFDRTGTPRRKILPSPRAYHIDAGLIDPRVAMDADGDFVVFRGEDNTDVQATYLDCFDASGNRVNTAVSNQRSIPEVVAMDADGDVIASSLNWSGDYPNSDIFARRLRGFEKVDLDLTKNDRKDPVPPGGVLDYRIRLENLHPRVSPTHFPLIDSAIGAASGIQFKDSLPPGTRLIAANGIGWRCRIQGSALNCTGSDVLRAGKASTLNLKLRAPTSGRQVTNSASVSGDQDDPDQFNNSDLERTTLRKP